MRHRSSNLQPIEIGVTKPIFQSAHDKPLVGTFVKLRGSEPIEILAHAGFDFVIVDAEHSNCDRRDIDLACLAGRAAGIAIMVRVADRTRALLTSALDSGAGAIVMPHINDADEADAFARSIRFRDGNRGYSNSGRSAAFGSESLADYPSAADQRVGGVAMIESIKAVNQASAIAATRGVDAVFVGRGDIAVSLVKNSTSDAAVQEAVVRVGTACAAHGKLLMVPVSDATDAANMRRAGANAFVVATDQAFLRAAAGEACASVRDICQ